MCAGRNGLSNSSHAKLKTSDVLLYKYELSSNCPKSIRKSMNEKTKKINHFLFGKNYHYFMLITRIYW